MAFSTTTTSRKLLTAALITFVSVITLASVLPFSSTSVAGPSPRSRIYAARASAVAEFEFTAEQELAAVTSFITAVASNALPASVDASTPIDPELVLEFGMSSYGAQAEFEALEQDVWARNPVVLYGKKHSAASRAVKATLSSLKLTPAPTFVDVDTREDAAVVSTILSRVTGASEIVLLVGGKVIATDDLEALEASGELKTILAAAGATVNGAEKVKVHERKQIKVTRTESGAVLEGQKRELTQEELVFRGFITL